MSEDVGDETLKGEPESPKTFRRTLSKNLDDNLVQDGKRCL